MVVVISLRNSDGANKGNPGLSSYGYCFRSADGNLIYAQSEGIGEATNMEAEARALLEALRYCKTHRMEDVTFETDSLSFKNIVQRVWRIPWELAELVEEIAEILKETKGELVRSFREGNMLQIH